MALLLAIIVFLLSYYTLRARSMNVYLPYQYKSPLHLCNAQMHSFLDQRNRMGIDVRQKYKGGDAMGHMKNISMSRLASDG